MNVQNIYNQVSRTYVANLIDFDKVLHILVLLLYLEKYAWCGEKFKHYKDYWETKREVKVSGMKGRKRSYLLLFRFARINAIWQ